MPFPKWTKQTQSEFEFGSLILLTVLQYEHHPPGGTLSYWRNVIRLEEHYLTGGTLTCRRNIILLLEHYPPGWTSSSWRNIILREEYYPAGWTLSPWKNIILLQGHYPDGGTLSSWRNIMLLEQHIAFLLENWQQNGSNNVLHIHGSVQRSRHKPQKPVNVLTYDTLHYDAKDYVYMTWHVVPPIYATHASNHQLHEGIRYSHY